MAPVTSKSAIAPSRIGRIATNIAGGSAHQFLLLQYLRPLPYFYIYRLCEQQQPKFLQEQCLFPLHKQGYLQCQDQGPDHLKMLPMKI